MHNRDNSHVHFLNTCIYFLPSMKITKKISILTKDLPPFDLGFFALVITLAIFGTVMIFSAGYAYAYARYDDGFYFIKKQAIWIFLGIIIMIFASRIHPNLYEKATPFLYAITLLLLILVLVVGFVGNGAKRCASVQLYP